MAVDHIILLVIGLAGFLLGLKALAEAKAYKLRHPANDKSSGTHPDL
ncbi:hypothetical protein [Sulfuriferula nivalis]|nr:hypothetical protein [Sulfuriferula nivalis]